MKFSKEVYLNTIDQKHQSLSVFNLNINEFLITFRLDLIEEIKVYWYCNDKVFCSSSILSDPVFEIASDLVGLTATISSIEISLSNGATIESNMIDEIFCTIPAKYDLDEIVIQVVNQTSEHVLPKAPKINWDTRQIE